VEVRFYGRPDDERAGTPSVPPGIGDVEVVWESDDPGATEARLKRWAIDNLTGDLDRLVYPGGRPPAPEPEHPGAFEWRTVFKPGDVV
jgi:hypothetical protein